MDVLLNHLPLLLSSTDGSTLSNGLTNLIQNTGFFNADWKTYAMLAIACILLFLAIVKKYEPLLLLPIAFGMLLANIPGANMSSYAGGVEGEPDGLLYLLYSGIRLGIYPPLIFLGIGVMTDFGPLLANPKSLLLGAAAQVGIFLTFIGARAFGFTLQEAGAIGIIGGADGPTAIFLTGRLAPELLGPIAVAAYSYMALVPVIQPPIMRALTNKKERSIVMEQLRPVSKTEKILFPIIVTIIVCFIIPDAAPLIGMLMFGNLLKTSGVVDRLSKTAENELINIVTIFLGLTVGATSTADSFLQVQTLLIIALGLAAFAVGTAAGILFGKIMSWLTKGKVNPLIGSAGVSAVPMAARVSQKEGLRANPKNFLLMHAMGPNVAGVIGSALAAGILLSLLG